MRLTWVLLLLLAFVRTSADETIIIASGEWPPYFSQQLPEEGVVSHVIRAAFAAAETEVQFEYFPWNRSLKMTRAGHFAMSPGWARTPDRERDFKFSHSPLITESNVFYYHKDNPIRFEQVWEYDPDKPIRLGATLGYNYGEAFEAFDKDNRFRLRRSPSDVDNLTLLLQRDIDVFPIDKRVGRELLKKHFSAEQRAQLAIIPQPLRTTELYLLFSRRHPQTQQLQAAFEQGMMAIHADGTYQRIVQQHGIDPILK
ncbi:hypothetical protein GCM10011297_26780 [Bacterioplanes sanyensis]|uniref:substrate-binding periplasmic protein n=1 Tax=Bacterioplanes sanyensis TaxID=1249553 RepID=UPI001673B3DC|nr:transporter substrate-binding domain-containing protein [Bacterioplanes sanyensis]GGY52496.1 hypothetical protein GCM10011297_26780 [Bacterioplanes sanyensis]